METVNKWNLWANAHTNLAIDAIRILFGAFMTFKGIFFLEETDAVEDMIRGVISGSGTYLVLAHYVALSHLCGGIFIMMGLLTRWCALVQLPLLIGAVLINFIGVMNASNLLQAALSLAACCFFIYYGSGRHSVDYSLKLHT